MKFVVQCVDKASVEVEGKIIGRIDNGFLVLIGVCDADTEKTADRMVDKLLKLRVFPDENGKTNLNLASTEGSLLLVSQFTLYADIHKGNRPSFVKAGSPQHAEKIYEYIVRKCKEKVPDVQTGSFGAEMKVSLVNDGPFTIIMDSEELGY